MQIVGHQKQLKLLQGFLKNSLFFSSYLFWGLSSTGKKQVAQEFVKGLLCQKSVFGGCGKCLACVDLRCAGGFGKASVSKRDFLFIDESFLPSLIIDSDDDKAYGIDTSRAVIKFLSTGPSVAQRKVVLIDNAHSLTQEAQNSLLKIIEEPPSNAVIILISHKPSFLYDTILSRTLQVYFPIIGQAEIYEWITSQHRMMEKEAQEISKFSLGRPGRAHAFLQDRKLLSQFKRAVIQLLSFEGKTSGQKVILLKNFLESDSDLSDNLGLWQGVLRDELLFSCGFEDLAGVLSQKRRARTPELIKSLKKLLSLSDLSDSFPATAEAAFKQMVLSKSL